MPKKTKTVLQDLREKDRETRRVMILDAAVRLFAQRSFNQVGMREIAAEAGISAAYIYRHFSNRDELFLEALLREATAIAQGIFDSLTNGGSSLGKGAANYVEYLLDHDTFFQMMTHFMVDGGISEKALVKFNAIERRILDVFEEHFRKIGHAENARLMAHSIFAALNGILITFYNYPGRSREEVRRHMLRLTQVIAEAFTGSGK